MSYPPDWRLVENPTAALAFMREHPFAQLVTARDGPRATRIPFLTDQEGALPVRLRGHLNIQNPQAADLDGQSVLVVFSGRHTYVSPNWRTEPSRGGTYDYEEVQVRGTVRAVADIDYFRRLIDDLSALIEPQYAEVGDYPVWQTTMASAGYVERLFPAILPFVVQVESLQVVSKLHQAFPTEDRRSIADHLMRSRREDSRAIAEKIRRDIGE